MGIPEEEDAEKGTEIFEAMTTENFFQIKVRYQTIDPGSSEKNKCLGTFKMAEE